MKHLIVISILSILFFSNLAAQQNKTTLSAQAFSGVIKFDKNYAKASYSLAEFKIPASLVDQFEQIDSLSISYWIGQGKSTQEQYLKDSSTLSELMSPIVAFSERKNFEFKLSDAKAKELEIVVVKKGEETCFLRWRANSKAKIANCFLLNHKSQGAISFFKRAVIADNNIDKTMAYSLLLYYPKKKLSDDPIYVHLAIAVCGKRYPIHAELLDMDNFLEDAVQQGLQEDNFPRDLAKNIMRETNVFFVGKCPICLNTESGFRAFSRDDAPVGEPTTPKEILQGLESEEKLTKQKAMAALINRYTEAHYQRLNMNPREISEMKNLLEEGRKTGMERKSDNFGDFCPSCDGACGVKK